MRFEKLNEDKIRITLSNEDLKNKDIDFHSFMSNSMESQDLFFDMLEEAEKEIGFVTKDYLIRIEALAMAGGDFILTVTRSLPEKIKSNVRKKVHIKKKNINTKARCAIYRFSSFEDYCSFIQFFNNSNFKFTNLAKKVLLYEYKNCYYFVLNNINFNFPNLEKLFSCITEFATFINNSEVFLSKLSETGKLIMKHNAICIGIKHFVKS